MNKHMLFKGIGLILLFLCVILFITTIVWLSNGNGSDAFKVGIPSLIALTLSIGSFILSYRYKKREGISAPLASQSTENIPIIDTMASNNSQVIIPEICPHCKNPNTNLSTTCEWCGNQIS